MSKVILITGASSGIGFDTARTLARKGHRVYATARRMELMESLKADGVQVLRMDVTDELSMVSNVESILSTEGHIDVLVNNAGYGYFGAVENVTMLEARRQLEVNLFGLARLCQLVLPSMRKQHSGRIINLSSIAGRATFPFGAWYNATKYSVEALSDALRMEVKAFGIDVVLIEPGPVKTDWGIIAARHLKESSTGTVYEPSAQPWANAMQWAYESSFLSKPDVITRAICHAALSRHPKTRYCRGRGAHLTLWLHTLLPTRWWDLLMLQTRHLRLGR